MGYEKLALISFRYPKSMILLWIMLFVLFGANAPKLDSVLKDHGLFPDGDHAKVQQILTSDFGIPKDPVMLLFEREEAVTEAQFHRFIRQTMLEVQGIDGLSRVISPLARPDMMEGRYAFALLAFSYPSYKMKPVIEQLEQRLPYHNHISVKMTGKSVIQTDVNRASHHDLAQAELIGIPIAFFILWLAFGSIVAAMLPVVIGVVGVSITMGAMYGLGTKIELSNFVLNVIPMVGLALSIDFALMLVSRFREELGRSAAKQALSTTMKTAGRAVLFSAAAVFLGLLGFVWIPLPMFSSIALGAMTVLAVSVLLTFTLLPALFTVLFPAIQGDISSSHVRRKSSAWYAMSRFVMKRSVVMGLLAALMLIVCLQPLSRMKVAIPDAASLPQAYDSRLAAEAYRNHFEFPGTSQVFVIAQGKALFMDKEDWIDAYSLVKRLESDPGVLQVESAFSGLRMSPGQLQEIVQKPLLKKKYEPALRPFVHHDSMLIKVTIRGEPSSKEAMNWVESWGEQGQSSKMSFLVGGEAKVQQEVFDAVFDNLGYVFLFIFVSNFIMLFAAFRSVLIAFKTIVMNLLSLGASFGILAWLFEGGRLGMEPGSIAIMIPVFIFGLVFGISMDYGVFLVSRMYEVYRQTQNNELAVLTGLASSSRIITAAAAIMIAVTAPFALGEIVGVKQLGIGIAAAIFIDATIVRMILVPALMSMLGKWNWWAPRWLK